MTEDERLAVWLARNWIDLEFSEGYSPAVAEQLNLDAKRWMADWYTNEPSQYGDDEVLAIARRLYNEREAE